MSSWALSKFLKIMVWAKKASYQWLILKHLGPFQRRSSQSKRVAFESKDLTGKRGSQRIDEPWSLESVDPSRLSHQFPPFFLSIGPRSLKLNSFPGPSWKSIVSIENAAATAAATFASTRKRKMAPGLKLEVTFVRCYIPPAKRTAMACWLETRQVPDTWKNFTKGWKHGTIVSISSLT